jgi:hypothetical protein
MILVNIFVLPCACGAGYFPNGMLDFEQSINYCKYE